MIRLESKSNKTKQKQFLGGEGVSHPMILANLLLPGNYLI